MASGGDDTCAHALDQTLELIDEAPLTASPVVTGEHGTVISLASVGDRLALDGDPERGDQGSTGDEDLEGRQRIASGDAGSPPAGNGPAAVGGRSGGGSVSASSAGPRPITPIRSTELGDLANEVGHDTGIVERFVVDFLKLLDRRLAAVTEALADSDSQGAITVLRSLETTGAMLGADELVEATTGLRHAVRDRPGEVDERLRLFLSQAEALRVRLTALASVLTRQLPPQSTG